MSYSGTAQPECVAAAKAAAQPCFTSAAVPFLLGVHLSAGPNRSAEHRMFPALGYVLSSVHAIIHI